MIMNGGHCPKSLDTISRDEVTAIALSVGFEEDDLPMLHCIVGAESLYRPRSASHTLDFGLTQINIGWFETGWNSRGPPYPEYNRELLMQPEYALQLTYLIYKRSGWEPWVTYQKICKHKH